MLNTDYGTVLAPALWLMIVRPTGRTFTRPRRPTPALGRTFGASHQDQTASCEAKTQRFSLQHWATRARSVARIARLG